jgi:hypothetical protein
MVRNAAILGLLVLLSACASTTAAAPQRAILLSEKGHGLFVGHTDNGEVIVASSHYDAVRGIAVEDTDLGVPKAKSEGTLLCAREVPTGSHVPHWMCRYMNQVSSDRTMAQTMLEQTVNSPLIATTSGSFFASTQRRSTQSKVPRQ